MRGCKADCALINSGTLRADVVYPAGPFTVEDMVKLLPFDNHLVSVSVTGAQLLEILENGVSQWPKKEGRFPQASAACRSASTHNTPRLRAPQSHRRRKALSSHSTVSPQVSNIKFTFDGRLPSGARVIAESVSVAGAPLELGKEYVVACLDLAASGKARTEDAAAVRPTQR